MTTYDAGDLVLVLFPFTSLKTSKRRPALVLRQIQPATLPSLLIVAMVTSQLESEKIEGDYIIREWKPAGLLHPSKVRLAKLVSLERGLVIKRLGSLRDGDRTEIGQALHQLYASWFSH